jgi:NADH-quinone oxidoreductase subunit L
VQHSTRWGHQYAYWCVLGGVFVTALYTFRMLFLTFHGEERFRHQEVRAVPPVETTSFEHETEVHLEAQAVPTEEHHHRAEGHAPRESPWVVVGPLVALAIPSIVIGGLTVDPVLFGGYFGSSIFVLPAHNVIAAVGREVTRPVWLNFAVESLTQPTFWVALAGVITAWVFFLWRPAWADVAARVLAPLRTVLVNKFYFDWFNENIIAASSRRLATGLWRGGDQGLIDGALVNGTAATIGRVGGVVRLVQSGFLYSYAFWMIIGLAVLIGWFLLRTLG